MTKSSLQERIYCGRPGSDLVSNACVPLFGKSITGAGPVGMGFHKSFRCSCEPKLLHVKPHPPSVGLFHNTSSLESSFQTHPRGTEAAQSVRPFSFSLYLPVWPNPPDPRSVEPSFSISVNRTKGTCWNTSWAILSPRRTTKGSLPRL